MLSNLCFLRWNFICGSGNVNQISLISPTSKTLSINSIWHLRKQTFFKFSEIESFAPFQILAPLMSIPIKFWFGYLEAYENVYSPFPHPSSRIIGLSFLKKFDHLPFNLNLSLTKSSRLGCSKLSNDKFSLNLFSLFPPKFIVKIFQVWKKILNPHQIHFLYIFFHHGHPLCA